jgi:hypothetical protein
MQTIQLAAQSITLTFGIGAALALAACGSSTSHHGNSTPYGPASSPVAMSKCMRANGLTNFPDPSAGPSGSVGFAGIATSPGEASLTVDGITFAGPALKTAEKACRVFLPPSGPLPKPSASQLRVALAFARCMRSHGVPNFPDPTFSSTPPQGLKRFDPNSPAFQNAIKVCGGPNGRNAIG